MRKTWVRELVRLARTEHQVGAATANIASSSSSSLSSLMSSPPPPPTTNPAEDRSNPEYYRRDLVYTARVEKLHEELKSVFKPLEIDEETETFFRSCFTMSWWDVFANAAAYVVKIFMTHSDTNAFLSRGQMHCISRNHFLELIGRGGIEQSHKQFGRLLDVGAGDGNVTKNYMGFFNQVVATEVSHQNCLKLQQLNIDVVETGQVTKEALGTFAEENFDVVCCLNLLDRCDRPYQMLTQIRDRIGPDGCVILAVVLPFCAFVEAGPGEAQRAPLDPLRMPKGCDCGGGRRMSWEQSVNNLYEMVLKPCGYDVKRLARVPYLSRGDFHVPIYALDDAVFVLTVAK